jgi:hypothetical protein
MHADLCAAARQGLQPTAGLSKCCVLWPCPACQAHDDHLSHGPQPLPLVQCNEGPVYYGPCTFVTEGLIFLADITL